MRYRSAFIIVTMIAVFGVIAGLYEATDPLSSSQTLSHEQASNTFGGECYYRVMDNTCSDRAFNACVHDGLFATNCVGGCGYFCNITQSPRGEETESTPWWGAISEHYPCPPTTKLTCGATGFHKCGCIPPNIGVACGIFFYFSECII